MHWKGLRLVADKKQSTIEPGQSRRSEHLPRPYPPAEPRLSESIPRSGLSDNPVNSELQVPEDNESNGVHQPDFAPSEGNRPSLRHKRFSFMRLRHASDPQLSKSYVKAGQNTPPVPSLPPPKIITTAPTSHELDQPVKQRPKLSFRPSSRKQSMEEISRKSMEQPVKPRRRGQGSTDSQVADSTLAMSQSITEEPGRLSTNSLRGNPPTNDSQRSSVVDPRFSESSRSDQSYDHTVTPSVSPRDGNNATIAKRFRMPRLKRHRTPLFPLPPKVSQPAGGMDRSKFPPADTPKSEPADGQDQVSPLPSPSRSTVGLAASSVPPLFRNDSTNSARSVRSNPSVKNRGRSSTMGSLAENQDDLSIPPYLASSARTSTSTSGRKSFSDMFNITQRLRQNSSPPAPRQGSPAIGGASTPILKQEIPAIPKREENDTPASYLTRLEETLPRGMIAGVLAQSEEEFYKICLRKYMRTFSYFGDPLDMAIRKLLMEVELPKETQQIDRFVQAFADRYHECNPGIFTAPDNAYFIAFSLLILHTDVFNKNNKRKMQKADYVKISRSEGISEDILECFYENISYTPFIRVEDTNLPDRHLAKPRRTLFKSTSSENLARIAREPVDPYSLILEGKLGTLRPSLKDVMDLDDTYNHFGTAGPPDMDALHLAFTKSGILQIISLRSRPDAFMPASLDSPLDSNPGLVDIKVAKVGLLWRKDPKKKKARSPWQEWGAILTFSQLYFFRNVNWVRSLIAQQEIYVKNGRRGTLVFKPPLAEFKPDNIVSTGDTVALLDSSYKKHKHAFMFVRHNALEEIFLAGSEPEMNDWLAHLNYAAAFRTTGVRTKGMIATNYEGQRYRRSQRLSSISSQKTHQSTEIEPPSPSIDTDIVAEFVAARRELMSQKIRERNEKLAMLQKQLDDLLQDARHLQVLTPLHARARESVIMAAGRLSAKIKWVRQDIWRSKCYRQVLLRDLGEDDEAVESRVGSIAEPTPSQSDGARLASLSGPSVTSEPSMERSGSIVHTVSSADTPEPNVAQTEQPSEAGLLAKPSNDELRRPSIPASVTSSDIARVGRRRSAVAVPERAKSYSPDPTTIKLEREASRASRWDGASMASRTSKLTSPASFDDGEERVLREAGLLALPESPSARKDEEIAPDALPEGETSPNDKSDRPSRVRRSLHRTLRDSHTHRNHSHSKKKRGSVSSLGQEEDDQVSGDGEVLPRKAPSFIVHGKKASIVTFGSEWQNMPPEQRLKLRKPTPHDEPRASDPAILGSGESAMTDRSPERHSVRRTSTATGLSVRTDDLAEFKDAQEEQPEDDFGGPASPVITTLPTTDADPLNTEDTPYSPSSTMYNSHLSAPRHDGSPSPSHSSTSINERIVDTPSSENLRQQAVGA
ncbi:SEC7-like alpha orthogonal bundle [Penicillium concentricum]|uniref:SEC7-like alpha orthogonal bundle n=1 Tax=Penicillium concentricum TaxID=293559 RepID=A0A9W9V3Y3_9EURO|nr:SEC7-like alpha orthogonal bundle [Penicillium concentricum]KAJ5365351.1 SEC7-like alpha orthogonal bundle [Penicillium concentricum]